MRAVLNYLTLFTSFSTLFCCALPALLVGLGLGAAMAGLLSKFPQLIWLSENKTILFSVSGFLLLVGGYTQFFYKASCPIDQKEACGEVKSYSKIIYFLSLGIYMIGFSFAFIVPRFL